MGARPLVIVSMSMCLFPGTEQAYAQSAPGEAQTLPPIVVSAPATRAKRGASAASRARGAETPRRLCLLDHARRRLRLQHRRRQDPGQRQFRRRRRGLRAPVRMNITDALQQQVPGISISEVAGNPFQPNVEFRGFVASPVAGTPQGLAVYQNGVRINEAFGDTVNWDLIPTAAIKSVSVVTNNPAFGLNALGGAVNVQMKDGFNYHGAEIDTMGGSFGRIQSSAQWGKQVDKFCRLRRPRRPARQRLSQFFGLRRPPLLRRCRLQERRQRIPPQHGRRRQQVRRDRDRRRSNCCSNIGARPTPRRRSPITASAMSI